MEDVGAYNMVRVRLERVTGQAWDTWEKSIAGEGRANILLRVPGRAGRPLWLQDLRRMHIFYFHIITQVTALRQECN